MIWGKPSKGRLPRLLVTILLLLGCWGSLPVYGSEPTAPTGFLKVTTDPEGATVEVDSGEQGTSPTVLEVPVGVRRVRLAKEGFRPHSEDVSVSADAAVRLQVKLSPSPVAALKTVTERRGRDGAEMILVPEGEFLTGSSGEGSQKVSLKSFWIDKYEVTHAQYADFLSETGHREPLYWDDPAFNQPEQPVVGVTWGDAVAYARWDGKRLPMEAEWEKAARGVDRRSYPWGETWRADSCNSSGAQDGFEGLAPVGKFPLGASPYGLMDMAGNVWEWVADESGQGASAELGRVHVGKGGSWANSQEEVKITARAKGKDALADCIIGFRCAMDAD